ncbi:MAG: hypothetical protein U5N10_10090 [Gemmobacter sp.]|nr:hypothetical protein [Gemmobacter sp.]
MALFAVHHPRPAMAAQVVKRPHLAILPAHDDGAFAQQIKADPVAGRGQVIGMACHLPMRQEQRSRSRSNMACE